MKSRKRSNFISFSQSREYYLHRAGENSRQGRRIDSYKLTRRALESDPGDAKLWLDAANQLSRIGLCEKSSECITRAMLLGAEIGLLQKAVYLNLISRRMFFEADTLLANISPNTEGYGALLEERADEARGGYIPSHREKRSLKLLDSALRRYADSQRADPFDAYERHRTDSPYAAAMYSVALVGIRRLSEARYYAREALARLESAKWQPPEVVCACVKALALSRQNDAAVRLAERLDYAAIPRYARQDYIQTLAICALHKKIYSFCAKMVGREDADAGILHALSVSAALCGMDENKVMYGWRQILECDEENILCREYIRSYREGELSGAPDEYRFELGAKQLLKLNERLSAAPLKRAGENGTDSGDRFLCYLRGEPRLQEVGIWLRIMAEGEGGKREMGLISIRPDLSHEARAVAGSFAGADACAQAEAQYGGISIDRMLVLNKRIMGSAVWVRRIYEDVGYMLNHGGEGARMVQAAEKLLVALDDGDTRDYMFDNMDAACAALWCLSREIGDSARQKYLAEREYKISAGQLEKMLKRLHGAERLKNV